MSNVVGTQGGPQLPLVPVPQGPSLTWDMSSGQASAKEPALSRHLGQVGPGGQVATQWRDGWQLSTSLWGAEGTLSRSKKEVSAKQIPAGQPGWLSGLAPAFSPGCDPGVRGSSPMSGSLLLPLPLSLSLSLKNK